MRHILTVLGIIALSVSSAFAENATNSIKLISEIPSFHSLGFRWLVSGDANANAKVTVAYKLKKEQDWRSALDLHRVEPEAMEAARPPKGQFLFAGSIMFLEPGQTYEVRLSLIDPDTLVHTILTKTLTTMTLVDPMIKRVLYVQPQSSDQSAHGAGTKDKPINGLAIACKRAQPGDQLILLPGTYVSEAYLNLKGKVDAPIVISGSDKSKVIIEGGKNNSGFDIGGSKHVQIRNLTITKSLWAIRAIGASHLLVKDCLFDGVGTGVFGDSNKARGVHIINNHIKGVLQFPHSKNADHPWKKRELRGIDIAGSDHIFAYNTVHGFRDGIDVRGKQPIVNVDIHNNEIYDCYDDGMELDFSDHNVRAFYNRITNTGMGISFQPIHGGPAYAIKNVLYNLRGETWKIHLSPVGDPHRTSGGYMLHNTIVRSNPSFRVWSNEGPGHYFTMYNNLYIGTGGPIEVTCPMRYTKMDHNAYFHDGKFGNFAFWNKKKYKTIKDFAEETKLEQHGISALVSGTIFKGKMDFPDRDVSQEPRIFELKSGSPAVDRGLVLPSINDGFKGKAPDLGALEQGEKAPPYGVQKDLDI